MTVALGAGHSRGARRSAGVSSLFAGLRLPRISAVQLVMAVMFATVALAVTIQAQRVGGQDAIESLLAETTEASTHSAELRARVARAEAPAEVLSAAEGMGMVQPAAVVAVPAAGVDDASVRTGGRPVG